MLTEHLRKAHYNRGMMIRQKCPRCLAAYKFKASLDGKFVRCPTCNEKFQIVDSNSKAPEPDLSTLSNPINHDLHKSDSEKSRVTICPQCHAKYKFKPRQEGRIYLCKYCESSFTMADNSEITTIASGRSDNSLKRFEETDSSLIKGESRPVKKARVLQKQKPQEAPVLFEIDNEEPVRQVKSLTSKKIQNHARMPVSQLGSGSRGRNSPSSGISPLIAVGFVGAAGVIGFILLVLLIPAIGAARKAAREARARNDARQRESQAQVAPIDPAGNLSPQRPAIPSKVKENPPQNAIAPPVQNRATGDLYSKYRMHMERTMAFYEKLLILLQSVRNAQSAENANPALEQLINARTEDDRQWQTLPDLNQADDIRFTDEFRERLDRISKALIPDLDRIAAHAEINDAIVIDCLQTKNGLMELRKAFGLK